MHLEHIGIVVDDLAAATQFFTALGLEVEGEASVEGRSVDRINGLEGVRADIAILRSDQPFVASDVRFLEADEVVEGSKWRAEGFPDCIGKDFFLSGTIEAGETKVATSPPRRPSKAPWFVTEHAVPEERIAR